MDNKELHFKWSNWVICNLDLLFVFILKILPSKQIGSEIIQKVWKNVQIWFWFHGFILVLLD